MKEFEEVAIQYAPMISAIIRKLHIYRDFELFRQTGNIALWQAWQRYDEEKGNFTAFAYRSIQGAMLDELKKETKRNERQSATQQDVPEAATNELFNGAMESLPEWIELYRLSNQEQRLLELLYVNAYSLADIAMMEKISLAGMKKRRERLLKKLKETTPYPVRL